MNDIGKLALIAFGRARANPLSYWQVGAMLLAGGMVFCDSAAFAQSVEQEGQEDAIVQNGSSYRTSTLPIDQSAQQSDNPQSLLLRGTTGSGEQTPVFTQSLLDENASGEPTDVATAIRDTADPVRQLQSRARPVQPEPQVLDPLVIGTPSAKSNVNQPPSQLGTGALPETNPFEAEGFRIGSWRAFTSVEQSIGYSSNINQAAMGDGSAYSQTDLSLSLQSDWSRHSAQIDASGSYQVGLSSEAENIPSASVNAALNLDLVDGVAAEITASYGYTTESVTSSTITAPAATRPGVHSTGASIGLTRTGRKLTYSLRGSIGRTDYEGIKLTNGLTQLQGDRNNTLYSAVARIGYEASPAITPFVEVEAGSRRYDQLVDRNGDNRNSTILAGRVGVGIDLSEKLNGELSVGYQSEDYQGTNLETLSGVTFDGNLSWSPWRDTTINFTSSTDFSGSTTGGQNGSVIFSNGITATRQVNDRLSLDANIGVDVTHQDDGTRDDIEVTAGAGFTYWLNRFMALTGSVDHTNHRSSIGGSAEFDDTRIQTGIRLQR